VILRIVDVNWFGGFHSLYHDGAFCIFNWILIARVGWNDRNRVSAQIWELGFMKLGTLRVVHQIEWFQFLNAIKIIYNHSTSLHFQLDH